MSPNEQLKRCPYCKEEVRKDAVKCKHCHSAISEPKPGHKGVCPFCKEEIAPEAIKCKHCKSFLSTSGIGGSLQRCTCGTSVRPLALGKPVGTGTGAGDQGVGLGRERCFMVPVLVCEAVEEADPIGGYNTVGYDCRIEWKKVCFWSPI